MADIILKSDLPTALQDAESIDLMLAGLNAMAARVAPCLDPEPPEVVNPGLLDEAKLILVGVIKRWAEAGSGAVVQQSMGPFAMTSDTRQRGGWKMWPSDISDLQDLCKASTGNEGKAFVINIGPAGHSAHMPWCDLSFGSTCSCGANLTNGEYPLYEGGELS